MEKHIDQRAVLSSCKWSICLNAVVLTTVVLTIIIANNLYGTDNTANLPSASCEGGSFPTMLSV